MTVATKPVIWQPDRGQTPEPSLASVSTFLLRGAMAKCPNCGKGALFCGYLTPVETCLACAVDILEIRAEDAPPYFTMLIAGHIIVPLMLLLERARSPELWVHAAIFLPLTCVLVLGLLRPIKGATIGLMLRLGLRRARGDA